MSKLNELLQSLCPDGVEYKAIGNYVDYEQPAKYIVESTDYDDSYKTPVLTAGQSFILGYTNEKEGIYNASNENPVIIFDDFTGAFKWVDFPFKVKSSAIKMLTSDENQLILRYVFYAMESLKFYSDEHKRLWIGIYSNFRIPIPPLPVQREIVRILDNFTELTAELTAELKARKKQYEFYRDALLTFDDKDATILNKQTNKLTDGLNNNFVEWVRLGDICILKAGRNIVSNKIQDKKSDEYKYPCYGGNGIRGYVDIYNHSGEYVLIGRQGALCGNVCYVSGDFYATEHAIVVSSGNKYNEKFLYHLLCCMNLNQYKTSGAQPGLAVSKLERILVPIPPLSTQQKIVDVLDHFDALCNDLTSGLPAEIEARKKQYEYYRDKLLTFKELKAE